MSDFSDPSFSLSNDDLIPDSDDEFVSADGGSPNKVLLGTAAAVVACCCCCAATAALYYGTEPVMQMFGIPIPWL